MQSGVCGEDIHENLPIGRSVARRRRQASLHSASSLSGPSIALLCQGSETIMTVQPFENNGKTVELKPD
jgi:hypothetical protein